MSLSISRKNRLLSLLLVVAMLTMFICALSLEASAAYTKDELIFHYTASNGLYYSGKYDVFAHYSFGKVGILGKKVTIQTVNYLSQLSKPEVSFISKYAVFNVWVFKNDKLYKFYGNLHNGSSFKLPSGNNITVMVQSGISHTGWSDFTTQMKKGLPWSYARYRLKY